jgi:ubiquinone/menaquinone biosynthesis C-methylase UbiE
VKRQVAAHWNRRAPGFDDDFGHSIRTAGERAAWDRVLMLLLAGRQSLDALDAGCGTGFLAFELAQRGHRVTGVDFATAMVERARRKAQERNVSVRVEEADAENLPFPDASFDFVISRHLLWTLPHPEAAIDEWIRVLRPGGRLAVVDGHFAERSAPRSDEYAQIAGQLPFMGGRPRDEIEALLRGHGLAGVGGDSFEDLVAAQEQRMLEEGREVRSHERYAVWGDVAR